MPSIDCFNFPTMGWTVVGSPPWEDEDGSPVGESYKSPEQVPEVLHPVDRVTLRQTRFPNRCETLF